MSTSIDGVLADLQVVGEYIAAQNNVGLDTGAYLDDQVRSIVLRVKH